MTKDLLTWTAATGVMSALATGLGAIPVVLMGDASERWKGLASALAAGMMLAASVFSLAQKGLNVNPMATIFGLLLGAVFVRGLETLLEGRDEPGFSRRSWLILAAMFIHSIPEGMAIGIGFATGDFGFGLVMAVAISVHNIPEGVAVSLPLRAEGAGFGRCFWTSVLSSVPQPLTAVPALWLTSLFLPLLPWGLGFAGGAMIFVACSELIPDAVEAAGRPSAGLGVCGGMALMMTTSLLLETYLGGS